jgi:hypothetical protein
MDIQTQNQTQKAYGPIIGIIVVVSLVIAGGVYLFTSKPKVSPAPVASEITIIEKDVNSSLDGLTADIDLSNIDLSMGK